MKSIFNGVIYDIPEDKKLELTNFIKDVWNPTMGKGLSTDYGIKRIPTNVRSLSFTLFLKEWYEKNFKDYIIGYCDENGQE